MFNQGYHDTIIKEDQGRHDAVNGASDWTIHLSLIAQYWFVQRIGSSVIYMRITAPLTIELKKAENYWKWLFKGVNVFIHTDDYLGL